MKLEIIFTFFKPCFVTLFLLLVRKKKFILISNTPSKLKKKKFVSKVFKERIKLLYRIA